MFRVRNRVRNRVRVRIRRIGFRRNGIRRNGRTPKGGGKSTGEATGGLRELTALPRLSSCI